MFKISLDAGHGKDTPGKRVPDNSMHEWEFNQGVVKYMMDELRNYDVKVLRVDDPTGETDVPLKSRTSQVNNWGSDVHVSVHANASSDEWDDAHGIETFTYLTPSKTSTALAQKVQKQLIKDTGLSDRGVKKADFHMVRVTKMPSILVECGFMNNKKEAELLKSDAYRKKVALAIVLGLAEQFDLKKRDKTPEKHKKKVSLTTKWYYEDSPALKEVVKLLESKGLKYTIEEVK